MPQLKVISLKSEIPEKLDGLRFDQVLATLFSEYSRSRLQSWVEEGKATVNGMCLRSKDKVKTGQLIEVKATLKLETVWEPQSIPLSIIYKDESMLVVDKPAGLVVHPASGNPDHTLVNALLYDTPELKNVPRGGIVHRLDKDTSGLLVVARTLQAHTALIEQIQARSVKREYFTVVNGTFGQQAGDVPFGFQRASKANLRLSDGVERYRTIEAPIGRHTKQRMRMAVVPSGKPSVTHYRVVERFPDHSVLQIFLETGRTHQIRVHMAHIGHPLVGDPTYGGRLKLPAQASEGLRKMLSCFKRQALHARKLALNHPETGERMEWESPLPEDINLLLYCLRQSNL